jgi:hypothetical protein
MERSSKNHIHILWGQQNNSCMKICEQCCDKYHCQLYASRAIIIEIHPFGIGIIQLLNHVTFVNWFDQNNQTTICVHALICG